MSLSSLLTLVINWLLFSNPLSRIPDLINSLTFNPSHNLSLTPTEMIKDYGYPAESHIARTQDGYLLGLHRIPYGKEGKTEMKRIPILLFHGMESSSLMWLLNGPEKSLAYRLADEGYDVWMGNMRGNRFSKAHEKYGRFQKAFWDFSLDDIALKDLPASIDYILNITNYQRLHYIGHSAGNTILYLMTSYLPEYNDKINAVVSLAPALVSSNTKSFTILFLVSNDALTRILYDLDTRGSYKGPDILMGILDSFCSLEIRGHNLCGLSNLLVEGWDSEQINKTLLPLLTKTVPSGTSLKTLLHVSQVINTGIPAFFDHGEKENVERYGSPIPPLYNISNIKVPVKVYHGGNDSVVTPTDIELLYKVLPNTFGLVKIDPFDHTDFFAATDINSLLNDDVIETVNNITNSINNSNLNSGTASKTISSQNEMKNDTISQVPNNKVRSQSSQGANLTTNGSA